MVANGNASTGNAVVVMRKPRGAAQEMVAIDGGSGEVLWRHKLYQGGDPTSWGVFLSLPAVVHEAETGLELVVVWVKDTQVASGIGAVLTVLDGASGAVVAATTYLTPQDRVFAPFVVDPSDQTLIGQYVNDVQPECGRSYGQYMKCTGLGKYSLRGESVMWNQTMQDAFTYRMLALDAARGVVHVPGSTQYAYSYTDDGRIRWKIMAAPSTGGIFAPTVCPDGTVVYVNDENEITAWDTSVRRPKKPIWQQGCSTECPPQATVVTDGTLYLMEANSVVARSCATGDVLWTINYGSGYSFTNTVAVAPDGALYANVYHPGVGGALIKLE
ncbi:uncharacterized protein AMSG_08952 [Thecamonas trahens ATCC 50062]|uniref:Pyrrolo-quinoline quinone repeat domain-containing protein n=1 Tax=Thecamonas trahens ATCC 50062 TaxID=461836 RepID=A0A0L0DME6_THETB|nr:hypothetical protein AMSG_08952 [Thecamonas trahens ATCC 50062]KNC53445.1 hypothetical protein AMSG_08952 [Thecamonas trahens ATCC 50062]|eukprot:XP_013754480.1 hypothetical protein AMSG_08952 [Thecamonas trahens ATCC 50062]